MEPRPSARCAHVECDPDWNWQPRLTDYDLWFSVSGIGSLEIGGHSYPVKPRTLFFLRPGDAGWGTQDADDPLTVVYLHFDWSSRRTGEPVPIDPAWLPSRHIPFDHEGKILAFLSNAVHLMKQRQQLAAVEAKLLLQQALIEAYRQDAVNQGAVSRPDARITRVTSYLRSHPDARVSLEEAASVVNLSPAYFSRLFKAEVGVSFRQYLVESRLEHARYLLEETAMPISEISRSLGYEEAFLLSRQFKRYYGYPPSQVRKHSSDHMRISATSRNFRA